MQIDNENIYVEDVIRIDIEANVNNTGGAVINENGELIGIVSEKNNAVIPISRIKSLLKGLIDEGEIITRVDGIEVSRMSEIKEYAYKKNVGETLIISVIRDNVEKDIEIAL